MSRAYSQAGRSSRRRALGRAGWLALGLGVALAGLMWMLWVTYGAPADWTGPSAVVRYLKPVLYATVVASVLCFYRAATTPADPRQRPRGRVKGPRAQQNDR
ncbi:MAG TPA: hypothetical protein VFR07_13770 [Mycobacteriales bacterium]|nr:hypothetical protein [Mycobacteriales bacterium]